MSDRRLSFVAPIARGAYPERLDREPGWLDRQADRVRDGVSEVAQWLGSRFAGLLGSGEARSAVGIAHVVARVELAETEFRGLDDTELARVGPEIGRALRRDGLRSPEVVRSFALIREVAGRTLGERHYDAQLEGGLALLHGRVIEMETGEGKTLMATLAAGTAALAGLPTHVVTVNDYLARRDAEWMAPVYRGLGLSVSAIRPDMTPEQRSAAYACDVTYCANKELVFDYLRDRMRLGRNASRLILAVERLRGGPRRDARLLLRGLCFAIVDEADAVLIDEARTPVVISRDEGSSAEREMFVTALELSRELVADVDFEVNEGEGTVEITDRGCERLEEWAGARGGLWRGRHRREDLVCKALTALHVLQRDEDYVVTGGRVEIVDETTGRRMGDRAWEHGLHQLVQAKEGLAVSGRPEPLVRISYQSFFRRYHRLAGMTATAREVSKELRSVYGLRPFVVSPRVPLQRVDGGERIFSNAEEKWEAVARRIQEVHEEGRPILVGTRSVAASEQLADRLRAMGVPHRVLNARQDETEAEIIREAGQVGQVTVASNMAGRGTDIRLARRVAECGGLHVIATERHDARRLDRQLAGRCGRQGDPGSFERFASFEDELFRRFSDPVLERLARVPALAPLALRGAQLRVERQSARARRQLVQLDEALDSTLAFSGPGE